MLTADLPPLPPSYLPAGPPVSGILTTVEAANGAAVHLHRAEYTLLSPRGEFTEHGYAWRCTGCPQVTTGYPAAGFSRALGDATRHDCTRASGRG